MGGEEEGLALRSRASRAGIFTFPPLRRLPRNLHSEEEIKEYKVAIEFEPLNSRSSMKCSTSTKLWHFYMIYTGESQDIRASNSYKLFALGNTVIVSSKFRRILPNRKSQ